MSKYHFVPLPEWQPVSKHPQKLAFDPADVIDHGEEPKAPRYEVLAGSGLTPHLVTTRARYNEERGWHDVEHVELKPEHIHLWRPMPPLHIAYIIKCDTCGKEPKTDQEFVNVGTGHFPSWRCGGCHHRQSRRTNTREMYGRGRWGY